MFEVTPRGKGCRKPAGVLLFIALALIVIPTVVWADHTSFYVINRSPVALMEVYATSVVNRSFGQDLLGTSIIAPGNRKLVRPVDNRGCLFDVAFTFYGGHTVNRRNLNLCTITELSTTGQGVGVPNRSERPRTYQDWH
jgi:hypothetical protein